MTGRGIPSGDLPFSDQPRGIEEGTCALCHQQMFRTADDCWHPYDVGRPCPPEPATNPYDAAGWSEVYRSGLRPFRPGREFFAPLRLPSDVVTLVPGLVGRRGCASEDPGPPAPNPGVSTRPSRRPPFRCRRGRHAWEHLNVYDGNGTFLRCEEKCDRCPASRNVPAGQTRYPRRPRGGYPSSDRSVGDARAPRGPAPGATFADVPADPPPLPRGPAGVVPSASLIPPDRLVDLSDLPGADRLVLAAALALDPGTSLDTLNARVSARTLLRHAGIDANDRDALHAILRAPYERATSSGSTGRPTMPDFYALGRTVWFRSRTGAWTAPAIITATVDSLLRENVTAGHIPDLSTADHVHLTVLTAGKPGHVSEATAASHPELADPDRLNRPSGGSFQEWDIAQWRPEPESWPLGVEDFRLENQPPGSWMWPI